MLFIILWTAGRLYREAVVSEAVFSEIGTVVGEEGARQLMATLERLHIQEPGWWATGIALGTLVITASTVLLSAQQAMNRIFGVKPADSIGVTLWRMLRDRVLSVAMLVTIAFILTVSLVLDALVRAAGRFLAAGLGAWASWLTCFDSMLLNLAALALLFALLFRYLPDEPLRWRDTWFGALLTAGLFAVGQFLIGFFIGRSEVADLYDAAGSILVLMLWVYYASTIFLFGAVVTSTRADMQDRRRVVVT
jgi:membrane protein